MKLEVKKEQVETLQAKYERKTFEGNASDFPNRTIILRNFSILKVLSTRIEWYE